jgi:hypothetical protein
MNERNSKELALHDQEPEVTEKVRQLLYDRRKIDKRNDYQEANKDRAPY